MTDETAPDEPEIPFEAMTLDELRAVDTEGMNGREYQRYAQAREEAAAKAVVNQYESLQDVNPAELRSDLQRWMTNAPEYLRELGIVDPQNDPDFPRLRAEFLKVTEGVTDPMRWRGLLDKAAENVAADKAKRPSLVTVPEEVFKARLDEHKQAKRAAEKARQQETPKQEQQRAEQLDYLLQGEPINNMSDARFREYQRARHDADFRRQLVAEKQARSRGLANR